MPPRARRTVSSPQTATPNKASEAGSGTLDPPDSALNVPE
jgi:hypothetical protein